MVYCKNWNGQGKEFGGIDDILISNWSGMNIHFGWMEGLKPSSTEQINNQTVKTNYKRDIIDGDTGIYA